MFVSSSSPEFYFSLRRKDYIALSQEIQLANGKLGYLTITSPTSYVTSKGVEHHFDSNAALKAQILRSYW